MFVAASTNCFPDLPLPEVFEKLIDLDDDFPAMLVDGVRHIDPEKFQEWEKEILKLKTQWYDSHPADRERIENAARENAAGVFAVEEPSTLLFSDIRNLNRLLTEQFYKHFLEDKFDPGKMVETQKLIDNRSVRRDESKAGLRFVLDQFCGLDTFELPRQELGTAMDPAAFVEKARRMRKYLLDNGLAYTRLRITETEIFSELREVVSCERLIESGFNLRNATSPDVVRTKGEAERKRRLLKNRELNNRTALAPYRQVLGARLFAALSFLQSPELAAKCGEPPTVVVEIQQILAVWQRVRDLRETLDQFSFEARVNVMMLDILGNVEHPAAHAIIRKATGKLAREISKIRQSTVDIDYPFDHGLGQVSVAKYLLPEPVRNFDVSGILEAAVGLGKSIEFLLYRSVSRLGALAEKVEQQFGLEPLETPAPVKELLESEST